LPYFDIRPSLPGLLKWPLCRTGCVGVAGNDVIGQNSGGANPKVKICFHL